MRVFSKAEHAPERCCCYANFLPASVLSARFCRLLSYIRSTKVPWGSRELSSDGNPSLSGRVSSGWRHCRHLTDCSLYFFYVAWSQLNVILSVAVVQSL